jgi:hypothetical protein
MLSRRRMPGAMPHYRLHILDEKGGLTGAVEFECADDGAAKGYARVALGGGHCGELWRRINLDPPVEGNGHGRSRANE